MYKISYEEIVKKIKEEKKLSDKEIEEKVNNKISQLNNLVSKDGAAYIVANDLGIKIFDLNKKRFKINELMIGMTSMEVLVKLVQKNEVREFKKENREGKVQNLLIGDDTGAMRLVVWDETQINSLQEVKEGDLLLISNGYVRDNNGFKEIHLNKSSSFVVNPKDETLGDVLVNIQRKLQRKQIKDLQIGDNVSLSGTIVQLFEPKFYNACPECSKKLGVEGDKYKCDVHGIVKENITPILNLFFDDSTENIRIVAFRDNVASILKISSEEVIKLKDDINKFTEVREKVMGSQIIINGKVVKNEMFDRLEFIANSVEDINVKDSVDELLSKLK